MENLSNRHKAAISKGISKKIKESFYPSSVVIKKAEYVDPNRKAEYQEYIDGSLKNHFGYYGIAIEFEATFPEESSHHDGPRKAVYNARTLLNSLEGTKREYLFNASNFKGFEFDEECIFWEKIELSVDVVELYVKSVGVFPKARRNKIVEKKKENEFTEAQKQDISKKISKKVSKPVMCLNNGVIYSSQTVASEAVGFKQATISNLCRSFKNLGVTPSGRKIKRYSTNGDQFMFATPEEYELYEEYDIGIFKYKDVIFYSILECAEYFGLNYYDMENNITKVEAYPTASKYDGEGEIYYRVLSNDCKIAFKSKKELAEYLEVAEDIVEDAFNGKIESYDGLLFDSVIIVKSLKNAVENESRSTTVS